MGPTYKTSTNTSISHQNEKPLLPSAFLKRADYSLQLEMFIPLAAEPTVVKNNQTHIQSIDRCLIFSLEAYEDFTFYFFFLFFLRCTSFFFFVSFLFFFFKNSLQTLPEKNRIRKWQSLFKASVVCLNVICSPDLLFVLLLFRHHQNKNWLFFVEEILLQFRSTVTKPLGSLIFLLSGDIFYTLLKVFLC